MLHVPEGLEMIEGGVLRYKDDQGRWQVWCRISMCEDDVRFGLKLLIDQAAESFEARVERLRVDEMTRVSGDVECTACGREYRRHPDDAEPFEFLKIGCDGRRLKL